MQGFSSHGHLYLLAHRLIDYLKNVLGRRSVTDKFNEFDEVKLITDRYRDKGTPLGDIGIIVDISRRKNLPTGYLLAFTNPKTAENYAMFHVLEDDIELAGKEDLERHRELFEAHREERELFIESRLRNQDRHS